MENWRTEIEWYIMIRVRAISLFSETKSMSAEGRRTFYLRGWITGSPRIRRVSDRSGYAIPRYFHRERSSL